MSNLPISSKYRSQPDKPITEAEREDLAARLNEEFARGKVEEADYQHLLDIVFAARTNGDLVPVVEVLPPRATHDQPAIVAQAAGQPGEVTQSGGDPNRLALATMVGGGILTVLVILLLIVLL